MSISVFDIFSIGIGPSSSHTVGPMRAANAFCAQLVQLQLLDKVASIKIDLYGSLALTGKGHGTDIAILNGLENKTPEGVDPDAVHSRMQEIIQTEKLLLAGTHALHFVEADHLLFHQKIFLPLHSNGLRFTALQSNGTILHEKTFYSVGGGFIVEEEHFHTQLGHEETIPYPFISAAQLLEYCVDKKRSISEIMMENEKTWRTEKQIQDGILRIAHIMFDCIERGCHQGGVLPGGLQVKRRAPGIYAKLMERKKAALPSEDKAEIMHWMNLFALAVNEENAAGGRIVTAPTNGAAGVIPAVLKYYMTFSKGANDKGIIDFLLTAGAIAILYKKGASLSAAEVGCQGEIGVACSMAAGALTAVLGGTIWQIENAAEIGMEHHLGLTCDPIAGLVQIPCIERNAMGTVQAINASQLALMETGEDHKVSLDKVIATMLQTGKDMQTQYKETSLGGLAVNLPEC